MVHIVETGFSCVDLSLEMCMSLLELRELICIEK